METKKKTTKVKETLTDIWSVISWSEFARIFMSKSSSWLYHKLDGVDGNGKPSGFNEEELIQFRDSLYELSDKIRNCADDIKILDDSMDEDIPVPNNGKFFQFDFKFERKKKNSEPKEGEESEKKEE